MPSTAPPGIGTKLRRARIERSLSIEETAWRTRIRPELLRALELEEFDSIGHQAFVRSHLSSYARFLGIDPIEVIEQFESSIDEPLPSSIEELDRQVRVARKPPRPKWLIAATLSGVLLIAAAVVGMLGGQAERPVDAPLAAPSLPVVETPDRATAVPASEARVRIRVEAVDETNVSVRADGEQVFDGPIGAGASKTFRAREGLEIFAANAGTIRLRFNGEDLGLAGEAGDLYRARFGPRGRIDD